MTTNQGTPEAVMVCPPPVLERRASVRHVCVLEAVLRPLESPVGLRWGARVQSISSGGLSLRMCYPFKPGASLAVDLHAPNRPCSLLVTVVRTAEQADGTWLLGCEFATPLTEAELAAVL